MTSHHKKLFPFCLLMKNFQQASDDPPSSSPIPRNWYRKWALFIDLPYPHPGERLCSIVEGVQ